MMFLMAFTLLAQAQIAQPAAAAAHKVDKTAQQQGLQALSSLMEGHSTIIIDPKERANDYIKAFEALKQEKTVSKIYFNIRGGMKISNVLDVKAMPGNTLMVFRYNTPQGIKFQVVGIEDILGIEHL